MARHRPHQVTDTVLREGITNNWLDLAEVITAIYAFDDKDDDDDNDEWCGRWNDYE